MEDNLFELMQQKKQEEEVHALMAVNARTEKFGLTLSYEEARDLVINRNESLKSTKRVEFGDGILNKLIYQFCDSQYINQENYLQTLTDLQEIFYQFKNESEDNLTDDELITFMKEQFEDVCMGDLEYLSGTCLEKFAEAIRAGYRDYMETGGHGEYSQFDDVTRWDKDLYMQVLKEIFWD